MHILYQDLRLVQKPSKTQVFIVGDISVMHVGVWWPKRTYSPGAPDMFHIYSLTSPQVFQVVQGGK